jgi:hypothetical protein
VGYGGEADGEVFALDGAGYAVAGAENDAVADIWLLDFEAEDYVLRVEFLQVQVEDFVHEELDDDVFGGDVAAAAIELAGHFPGVDEERRFGGAIEIEADDFGVVEIGPVAEPIVEIRGAVYTREKDWEIHVFACFPGTKRGNRLRRERNWCRGARVVKVMREVGVGK